MGHNLCLPVAIFKPGKGKLKFWSVQKSNMTFGHIIYRIQDSEKYQLLLVVLFWNTYTLTDFGQNILNMIFCKKIRNRSRQHPKKTINIDRSNLRVLSSYLFTGHDI